MGFYIDRLLFAIRNISAGQYFACIGCIFGETELQFAWFQYSYPLAPRSKSFAQTCALPVLGITTVAIPLRHDMVSASCSLWSSVSLLQVSSLPHWSFGYHLDLVSSCCKARSRDSLWMSDRRLSWAPSGLVFCSESTGHRNCSFHSMAADRGRTILSIYGLITAWGDMWFEFIDHFEIQVHIVCNHHRCLVRISM